jgi:glucose-6-phosphate-specific signal transduction histidine kinase
LQKIHDELANDVYQLMKFVENKDISYAKIKEAILQNLDTIYNLTRNISIANSNIETGIHFKQQLKQMLFGFNTNATNIIINNLDAIDWIVLTDEDKITVYRVLQELLINMKKPM